MKSEKTSFSLGIVSSLSPLNGCYRVSGGQQEIPITFGEKKFGSLLQKIHKHHQVDIVKKDEEEFWFVLYVDSFYFICRKNTICKKYILIFLGHILTLFRFIKVIFKIDMRLKAENIYEP